MVENRNEAMLNINENQPQVALVSSKEFAAKYRYAPSSELSTDPVLLP